MKNLSIMRFTWLVVIVVSLTSLVMIQGCSSDSNGPSEPTKKGPQVVTSPELLDYGRIPVGQIGTSEYIIFNTGDEPLIISDMKIEGTDAVAFSLVDFTGEITIPLNKIQRFAVQYNPTDVKTHQAQVTITSNAQTSPDVQDLSGIALSSAGAITFERPVGSFEADNGGTVYNLDDGGFIVAGSSYDEDEDTGVATLFRFDQYGNVEWQNQYRVNGLAGFSSMVLSDEGNYVCTGTTRTNPLSNSDIYAISVDDNGSIIWQQVYNFGVQTDDGNEISKTDDGGYIICGASRNTDEATGGVKDALLIKISSNGTNEWHKLYGTTEGEEANSVKQTSDGGYIFAGSTTVPSTDPGGDFNYLLAKTDPDGNLLWTKQFGGDQYDFANSLIIDELGGYVMAGYTSSKGAGARDIWVIKTDTSGTLVWDKTYGGVENDSPSEIIQNSDNGFYIVGGSASFTVNDQGQPNGQVWVIKTDNSGGTEWDELYGGNRGDGGSSARQLDDGYIISGTTSSFGDNSDLYLVRTTDDGSI